MQVFADDGARIDVRIEGRERGNALVFIHGFPMTGVIWSEQFDALAATSHVLRCDLRGAGASSSPDGPYLMESLAADVAAVLDTVGVERATLIGHSMGGYVALAFARMFSERVTRLALIASRLRADTAEEAAARRMLADRVESERSIEPVIAAYLPRLLAPKTLAERADVVARAYEIAGENNPVGVAATLRGIALRSSSEDIAEDLDVPVLVIAGGADRVVPLEEATSIAHRFPHGRLVVCAQSGHLPMLEQPTRVTEALADWLLA